MSYIAKTSIAIRLGGKLPPTPPHPAALQTIGGRRWPYAYLEHCQRVCGDPFTLYPLDMPPMVFLSDPQDIREVLTGDASALHPGVGGHVIAPLIGERSFMLREEEEHAFGRKTITRRFTAARSPSRPRPSPALLKKRLRRGRPAVPWRCTRVSGL